MVLKGQVSKGKFILSVVDWEKSLRGNFTTQFNKAILCFTRSLEYLYTTRIQLSGKNNVLIKFSQLTEGGEKKA